MTITERGTATQIRGASPRTPTAPTGIAAGDLAYIAVTLRGGDGTTKANVNSGMSGWTKVFEDATGVVTNTDMAISIWRKVWAAGDAAPTVGWQNDGTNIGVVMMSAWIGVDTFTPEDVVGASLSSGTLATPTTATVTGITTVTENTRLLGVVGGNNANITSFTVPASWTDEVSNVNRPGSDLASIAQAAKGASGNKSWTFTGGTGGSWAGLLWALRPAQHRQGVLLLSQAIQRTAVI